MAAPVHTARQTPVGIPLRNGYVAKLTFAIDPDISFWEIEVTPPGFDVGDAIDQTTMYNIRLRSKWAPDLVEATNGGATVAYDPVVVDQVLAILGIPTTITHLYRDGSRESHLGFLKSFKRSTLTIGERPTAEIEIIYSETDTTGAEQMPLLTSVAGT